MAGAVAERAWRESSADDIEADLSALWREAAKGDVKIARAVMSNLIVVCAPCSERRALSDVAAHLPLDEVAARHPSRTIVLEHCDKDKPSAPLATGVAIVTFGPASARYGVEQIVVRSACPEPSLLSILRRLVRGDLPTSVWWTEDLSDRAPFDPLLTVGRQVVYDSRQWRDVGRGFATVLPLADGRRVDLADLNWRRLAPFRRALEHARGALDSGAWRGAAVEIEHARGEEAIARLLSGWLRGDRRRESITVTIRAATPGGAEPVLRVSVGDAIATLTPHAVEISSRSAAPLVVAVPKESDADAIAGELRSLSPDAGLLSALRGAVL